METKNSYFKNVARIEMFHILLQNDIKDYSVHICKENADYASNILLFEASVHRFASLCVCVCMLVYDCVG